MPDGFAAFISYSHLADQHLGPALRDGLHRFARPWNRLRALRVFCDTQTLASAELRTGIFRALDSSQCLILLASPQAAEADWVRDEINRWKSSDVEAARRKGDPKRRIVIGHTSGEIVWDEVANDFDWELTTALPHTFRGWFDGKEPRLVDLRELARADPERELSFSNPVFLDKIAEISAMLQQVDKDVLIGRDVAEHARSRRFRRFSFAGLAVLTALAIIAAVVAGVQRQTALDRRDEALANQLVAEASTVQDTQPGLSRQMIAIARGLKQTPQVAAALAGSEAIPQEIIANPDHLAYNAQSNLLAVAEDGRGELPGYPARNARLQLYDAMTLRSVYDQDLGDAAPVPVAFSPSAPLLAYSHGHDLELLDVTSPRAPAHLGTLAGHREDIVAVAFRPGGQILATGDDSGEVRLWRMSDNSLLSTLQTTDPLVSFSLGFQPSGSLLFAESKWWDISDPQHPKPKPPLGLTIDSAAFSPDGSHLATISKQGVQLWDFRGRRIPALLPVPDQATEWTRVAFGPGDQVAAVGADGHVNIWDVSKAQSPALETSLPVPSWSALNADDLVFSPDGTRLALAAPGHNAGPDGRSVQKGTVRIWNIADRRERRAIAALRAHSAEVSKLATSPDHRTLASAGGGTVQLWDVSDILHSRRLAGFSSDREISALQFSPDGNRLAAVGQDAISLVDITDREHPLRAGAWQLEDRRGACPPLLKGACQMQGVSVAFSNDAKHLAVGDTISQISLFDTTQPDVTTPQAVIRTDQPASELRFLPGSGSILAVANWFGSLELWDVTSPANNKRIAVLGRHDYQVQDLAFSPSSGILATAGRDGTARLSTIDRDRTLTPRATITDTGDINALALSPSGRQLATIGRDQTLRTYDLTRSTPRPVVIIRVGDHAATALAYVGGETALALATTHGEIDLWNLDTAGAFDRLCHGVGEPINRTQWRRIAPNLPYRPPCK